MKNKVLIVAVFMLLQFICVEHHAYSQNATASAIKASWIDHFSKFIEWPNINDTTSTFVIKVIGEDEFDGFLNKIYDERSIKNLPVQVYFIKDVNEIGDCHILYISKSKRNLLDNIFETIGSKPILTLGSTYGYAQEGVIINFYTEDNKIRFEFNISAAKEIDLDVSFRLLELAKIVKQN